MEEDISAKEWNYLIDEDIKTVNNLFKSLSSSSLTSITPDNRAVSIFDSLISVFQMESGGSQITL